MLFAPKAVAIATCGFTAGDDPPCVGKEWQPTQLSRLKRGPSPSVTVSSCLNEVCPWKNSVVWSVVRPGTGFPKVSVALVGLTPGSAAAAALAIATVKQLNKDITTAVAVFVTCEFITPLPVVRETML